MFAEILQKADAPLPAAAAAGQTATTHHSREATAAQGGTTAAGGGHSSSSGSKYRRNTQHTAAAQTSGRGGHRHSSSRRRCETNRRGAQHVAPQPRRRQQAAHDAPRTANRGRLLPPLPSPAARGMGGGDPALQLQKGTNTWHHKPVLGPAAKQYYYDWMRIWVVGRRADPPGLPLGGANRPISQWEQVALSLMPAAREPVRRHDLPDGDLSERESGPTRTMKTTTTRNKQTKMGGNPPASCREGPRCRGAVVVLMQT